MTKYATPEIATGIYAVGVKDWNRRIFDAIAPTPMGTTYNSYLVKGAAKIALIDTVHAGFEDEFSGKIEQVLGSHAIDYLIMNHAEPDHAGLIPYILAKSRATLVATEKGVKLAQLYYKVPDDRLRVVADSDTIDLGGKTVRFIHAPHLHWPETMFTYIPEDRLLFSCDFFGSHNTTGLYDDEAEDVIMWAKKYFGEIMMPLAKMGQRGMEKVRALDVAMIAPSHGPIYRHPETILAPYTRWTDGETQPKALLVYVSMYHTVERMVLAFAEILMAEGVEVRLANLVHTDPRELAGDLVDARALVLGTPTLLGNIHPLAQYALTIIKTLRPPMKHGVLINSYGWGKGAINKGLEMLKEAKVEPIGTIEVNGSPNDEDFEHIRALARQLAGVILADGK